MWILPNLSVTLCHNYYVHLPYLQVVKLKGKLFSSTLEMGCLMPSVESLQQNEALYSKTCM